MRALLRKELTETEVRIYKQSKLFERVIEKYEFTDNGLEYYQEYFGDTFRDESILVFKNDEPVLIIHAFCKGDLFAFFGNPISIISIEWTDNMSERLAYKTLLKKLQDHLVLSAFKKISFFENRYLTHEYYRKIIDSNVQLGIKINLREDLQTIKSNIRKSYKSLVNWGEKNLQTTLFNCENATPEDMIAFQKFHFEVSGRSTRSDKSWEIQFNAIKNKYAFMVCSVLENKIVAYSLILCGTKQCYYGVGVYDRELMAENIGVAHYNILHGINYAKQNGFEEFHLGSLNVSNTEIKEINIFNFKAGFAKEMVSDCFFISNC